MTCPCGENKPYKKCCGVFHEGKVPTTPEELMRSRYTAYKMGLVDYIMETTDPEGPAYHKNMKKWKNEIAQFSKFTTFDRLEIHQTDYDDDKGTVLFTAHLAQNGEDVSFTELSTFVKKEGRWLYHERVMH